MSRIKKKRSFVSQYIIEKKPSKEELLADENSKLSLKKKAHQEKKKHKSVFQKEMEKQKQKEAEEAAEKSAQARRGRLADKIIELNKQKASQTEENQDD